MRVVRSPDSAGVALDCAAVLLHSTAAVIVCLLPSIMTVVLDGAALELVAADGWPFLLEQAGRVAPNASTPSPAAARTSRRRAARVRWRHRGLVISRPLLERQKDYRARSFLQALIPPATRQTAPSPVYRQASHLPMVRNGPANTGRTAPDRHRCSMRSATASLVVNGSPSR